MRSRQKLTTGREMPFETLHHVTTTQLNRFLVSCYTGPFRTSLFPFFNHLFHSSSSFWILSWCCQPYPYPSKQFFRLPLQGSVSNVALGLPASPCSCPVRLGVATFSKGSKRTRFFIEKHVEEFQPLMDRSRELESENTKLHEEVKTLRKEETSARFRKDAIRLREKEKAFKRVDEIDEERRRQVVIESHMKKN